MVRTRRKRDEVREAGLKLIPGAREVILPGLRHMALAESPQVFNQALGSFLQSA